MSFCYVECESPPTCSPICPPIPPHLAPLVLCWVLPVCPRVAAALPLCFWSWHVQQCTARPPVLGVTLVRRFNVSCHATRLWQEGKVTVYKVPIPVWSSWVDPLHLPDATAAMHAVPGHTAASQSHNSASWLGRSCPQTTEGLCLCCSVSDFAAFGRPIQALTSPQSQTLDRAAAVSACSCGLHTHSAGEQGCARAGHLAAPAGA